MPDRTAGPVSDDRPRPLLRLRLHNGPAEPGELSLTGLARLAEETQSVVRCVGRALTTLPGYAAVSPGSLAAATRLRLVGLGAAGNATLLDVAGPDAPDGGLLGDALPMDIGALALRGLVDTLVALDERRPSVPDWFVEETRAGLDAWLRRVRRWERVGIAVSAGPAAHGGEIDPRRARQALAALELPPESALRPGGRRAVEGVLYALNLHTGTFAVEDDHGQRIRLTVPDQLRAASATLISLRIRAEGTAVVDEDGRLHTVSVAGLDAVAPHLQEALPVAAAGPLLAAPR